MAVKVTKVADIVGGKIILLDQQKYRPGDLAAILTNLPPASDPNREFQWQLEVEIGTGPTARQVVLDLACLISKSDGPDSPLFLGDGKITYFRHQLFIAEGPPKTASEREEAILRVKKAVYDDEADLANLRAAVANLEAAIEFEKSGPKRDRIPEDVKLVVWARDGGACVRCGSRQNLHFDHIIPVSKGGGHSEENIQILCDRCNLRKSDKISF